MLKIKDNLKNQLLLASCVNRISLFGALCALLSAVNATIFELDNFTIFFFSTMLPIYVKQRYRVVLDRALYSAYNRACC